MAVYPKLKGSFRSVSRFANFVLNNKEKILSIISKSENRPYRVSQDIVNSKFPKDKKSNRELLLKEKTDSDSTIRTPYLELSAVEDNILMTLCQLLAENSATNNQASPEYYMGNSERGLVTVGEHEAETARLVISPHELYSSYFETPNYGSGNSKYLLKNLLELAKKYFFVSISFPSKNRNGTQKKGKFDVLRTLTSLFNVSILNKDLTEQEVGELLDTPSSLEGRGCKLLFKFNPIFTSTIRDRYVEYPSRLRGEINKALLGGRGGTIPQCVNLLRDLLLREKQQGKYNKKRLICTRDIDTLVRDLGLEKERADGRKKRVNDRIAQALDTCKKVGILISYKMTIGTSGQYQVVMRINEDFK